MDKYLNNHLWFINLSITLMALAKRVCHWACISSSLFRKLKCSVPNSLDNFCHLSSHATNWDAAASCGRGRDCLGRITRRRPVLGLRLGLIGAASIGLRPTTGRLGLRPKTGRIGLPTCAEWAVGDSTPCTVTSTNGVIPLRPSQSSLTGKKYDIVN